MKIITKIYNNLNTVGLSRDYGDDLNFFKAYNLEEKKSKGIKIP